MSSTQASSVGGNRGRFNRGRGQRGGRGSRGARGASGFRSRDRGRGRGRGRGTHGSNRSAKPTRYQEYDCQPLATLSMKMNRGKAFYLVNKKSIYTDVDVESYRDESLRAMVDMNETNQRIESTIKPPADFPNKLNELVQKKMTEKGFSNCWPLSGSFFDDLFFHGWTISFKPSIPMHDRSERKVQLFGGIPRSNWEARRKKFEYLDEIFGDVSFDNQAI